MKFLIDMNLSPLWVPFLGSHGFVAIHWSAVGDARAPDSEILDWAAVNNCVVLTHDLDFGMLLAALPTDAPSVVQVRCQDVLPASIGEQSGQPNINSKPERWLPWILRAIGFDCFHFEDSTPARDGRGL